MRVLPKSKKALLGMAISFSVICGSASAQVVNTPATAQIDQMEAQSRGEFAELNIDYARPLGLQQNAWVNPLKHMGEGQTKPAYSRYYWKPDVVLPIRLREGMVTLINFPEWELVENVFIGDEVTFDGQIVASNALLVYPKQPGADTNMVVFSRSGNRYVFYMRSETYNAERITNSIIDIEVVGAKDGKGRSSSAGASGKGSKGGASPLTPVAETATSMIAGDDWLDTVSVNPTKFRFDLDVFVPYPEDSVVAPERVWRDDVFTYIDLGQKALSMHQRPVVSLLVEGTESPVGFRTEGPYGRMIVVEAIGDLVLRSGRRVVCIKMQRDYDDALDMSGVKIPGWTPGKEGAPGSSWKNGRGSSYGVKNSNGAKGMYLPKGAALNNANGSKRPMAHPFVNGAVDMNTVNHRANSSANYGLSVELGSSKNVRDLEDLWSQYTRTNKDLLSTYSPYYSLDMSADSIGDEAMFHLRIGPVDDLVAGDELCRNLGERGIGCMVVRVQ
ncbi:MAG: TrbG/VirB9 family P-type conjugative transfer protein [Alphaproteobacteria bacterium]|nr:TrbG/VirB9 family P-type conjugative transfer protein [Alphaproteobacteria bacterium]